MVTKKKGKNQQEDSKTTSKKQDEENDEEKEETSAEKRKRLNSGLSEAESIVNRRFGREDAEHAEIAAAIAPIKIKHKLKVLKPIKKGQRWGVYGKVNPDGERITDAQVERQQPEGQLHDNESELSTQQEQESNLGSTYGPKDGEPDPNWGKIRVFAVCGEKCIANYKQLENRAPKPMKSREVSFSVTLNGEEPKILEERVGPPPEDMVRPHAHHIVFKKGRRGKMRQQVARSQRVLENHRIDWYKGEENLIWAPNSNHSTLAARKVADALEKAQREAQGLPAEKARARIVETLRQMGEKFADGSISEDD